MATLNKVMLVGNLTRDPEVRYTPSGTAVADLGMAVSDSYKNKSGELVETTCFVDIVVWGRQAETCGEYLSKGSPALIEGRLQFDQWENKQGEKRSKLRVKADRVQFLNRGGKGEGGSSRSADDQPPLQEPPPSASGEQNDDDLPF